MSGVAIYPEQIMKKVFTLIDEKKKPARMVEAAKNGGSVADAAAISQQIGEAEKRAVANGRKTVRPQDL